MNKIIVNTITLSVLFGVGNSFAAPLVYRGNNPNISPSASPYNAAQVEARANLTRPKEKQAATATESAAETLARGALAAQSSEINERITTYDSNLDNVNTPYTIAIGANAWISYYTDTPSGGVRTRYITTHKEDGTETNINFPI